MSSGWNTARAGKSVDGHPLSVGGQVYAKGVGTHAESVMTISLNKNALRFKAVVGLDDETPAGRGSVRFTVVVDGKVKYTSPVLNEHKAIPVEVSLKGANSMRLIVDDAGDGIDNDHADWADATIEVIDPKKPIKAMSAAAEPTMKIAHADMVTTRINGPKVVGCTPTYPFIFRIPASGQRPLAYSVKGLPKGLALDAKRGVISGRVPKAGTWKTTITVSGPKGKATRPLTIVAGKHKLALTPPMGWNSWNVWAGAVDQNKIQAAADSFVKTGLADFGYSYVNIDDCWEAGRDAQGNILTNEKFPSMEALSQYIHGLGLKLGIYSSPGPRTCAGFTASYKHELQDARSYAKWGVDYLKYDWCSYGEISRGDTVAECQKPYIVMREALDQVDRDIVYSLCQYGMGDVFNWGKKIGGNLWRTTGDITDTWSSMSSIGFQHSPKAVGVSPGGWNDPDMLVVGKLGWGAHPRQTRLTGNEQITHITLWSMVASPLIIGCDLTQIDTFTRDLLMNHEVIDIDQDSLGKAATLRSKVGDTQVWARPLSDGTYAVALFNLGFEKTKVTAKFGDVSLGLKGAKLKVRDLWNHKDLGRFTGSYAATVPAHGAVLVKVSL